MISDLVGIFKKMHGCIMFDGADNEEIEFVNKFLSEQKFSPMPREYAEFLKLTNGFIYNGIEFFGTTYHFREEKKYYFPDIITINKHYKKYNFFRDKVILGRLSESLLIYDKKENRFSIVDRIKLRARTEVKTFEEFLEILKKAC